MRTAGVIRVFKRFGATTGLLLFLFAAAAGADPLDADAAPAAASQPLPADVPVRDVNALVSASVITTVIASAQSSSTGDKAVGPVDDGGAFLGQLVAQYFESYN
jgi:hypothetical protein